jgi:hypothetical protein
MRLGGSVMLLVNRYRNKDKINLFRGFTLWKQNAVLDNNKDLIIPINKMQMIM